MGSSLIFTRAIYGVSAPLVRVETHVSRGLPRFTIVGMGSTTVRESKDRVRSALQNCGFDFPIRAITVNLSPADLPKDGSCYDLPIALGLLVATGQLDQKFVEGYEFAGELALTGDLRPVRGAILMALAAAGDGRALCCSDANANDLAVCSKAEVFVFEHLLAVCQHLRGDIKSDKLQLKCAIMQPKCAEISDVRGQEFAKRAMLIAAAGGHSLLMLGSPGAGKSMLAQRLPGLLPPMTEQEAVDVAVIYALGSSTSQEAAAFGQRPFRSPHHTASAVAMIGGGKQPSPGEVSLAHGGVLFLDEIPLFASHVLESLREPCETGQVYISRAAYRVMYPAQFQLIAAMNPCPCGYFLDPQRSCNCNTQRIERYRSKLSGPLLDRLDMRVVVNPTSHLDLLDPQHKPQNMSLQWRELVGAVRCLQYKRQGCINASIAAANLLDQLDLDSKAMRFLRQVSSKLSLSARGCHRMLRVARTVADLSDSASVKVQHLEETYQFIKPCQELQFAGE